MTPRPPQSFSRQFIRDFYIDIRDGKYVGRERLRDAIEHALYIALEYGAIEEWHSGPEGEANETFTMQRPNHPSFNNS